jgi:hypothetical protein
LASIRASGAQAATVGTEHDLATVTDPGTFVYSLPVVSPHYWRATLKQV